MIFNVLSNEAINEILNDIVKNKKLIPEILDYCKHLEIITVDIIKSLADEVNLYNEASYEFLSLLNTKMVDENNNLIQIKDDGSEEVLLENTYYNDNMLSRKDYYIEDGSGNSYQACGGKNPDGTFNIKNLIDKSVIKVKIKKQQKIHASLENVF